MILDMKVPSTGESISEVDSDKAILGLSAEKSEVITLKAEEGDSVAFGQVV